MYTETQREFREEWKVKMPINYIGKDTRLSQKEKHIMAYMTEIGRNGQVIQPKQRTIAKALSISERTVRRAIEGLKNKGYINVIRRGKCLSNIYEIIGMAAKWLVGKCLRMVKKVKKIAEPICTMEENKAELRKIMEKLGFS